MKLLKFLAAGKSLVGLREDAGRYQVTRQRLLPDFGTGRDPIANRRRRAGPEMPATMQSPPENEAGSEKGEPDPAGAATQGGAPAPGNNPVPASAPQGRLGRFFGVFLPSRKGGRRPQGTASARKPVQGELSLDRVRVVRNDLSDADVEVRPVLTPKVAYPSRGIALKWLKAKSAVKAKAELATAGKD